MEAESIGSRSHAAAGTCDRSVNTRMYLNFEKLPTALKQRVDTANEWIFFNLVRTCRIF